MHDVIVIGLGAMGSAAAYELAGAGQRVLGLEQFSPLHDKGSSHGKTRMIRMAYMEGDFYIPLLKAAYEKWHALDALSDERLITICGGFYCAPEDDPVVADTVASAKAHNLEVEVLTPDEIRKRFPAFTPPDDYIGVYEPTAGFNNPDAALKLFQRLAKNNGAKLHFDERVENVAPGDTGVEVRTRRETYRAKKVILTTGPWLKQLTDALGVRLPMEVWRMAVHWFQPHGDPVHFTPGPFVPNLWRCPDESILYGFPQTTEGEGVKYAFHNKQHIKVVPGEDFRALGEKEVEEIATALEAFIPSVVGHHLKSRPCYYSMTPDRHFLLGALPGCPDIVYAGGFSGHGFKFAPVIGEILKGLALGEQIDYDLSAFSLKRFG